MEPETKGKLRFLAILLVGTLIGSLLVYLSLDDTNGWIGGTIDDHGYMRLASWSKDSSGFHLNFSFSFGGGEWNNYYKNFTSSRVEDLNPYLGHYVEVGYHYQDLRLNWIHIEG